MRILVAVVALALLAGCNTVNSGYKPFLTSEQIAARKDLVPFTGDPKIREVGNPYVEIPKMIEDGYGMIGESRYADNMVAGQNLLTKAREVKAEVVTRYRIGSNTSSSMAPISTGSGGMFFMPMNSTVEYFSAIFWQQRKPVGTGVYVRDLTQEEAIKRGDANGAVVSILVKGFAGERAGLKVGDVVTHIGGIEVINAKDSVKPFENRTASSIDYRVLRDGKPITIEVPIDPMPAE